MPIMCRRIAFRLALIAAGCCAPGLAAAQAVAGDEVVRLSPADRAAAIEDGATRAARDLPLNGVARGVHGEAGVEVGSNGSHAVYGTTVVPLGETGSAAFSFLSANSGRWHER